MFKFLNKFFHSSNKPQEIQKDNDVILASITFLIKQKNHKLVVDIGLEDFEEDSIIALAELLNNSFTDQARMETLNIIQQSFIDNNEESAFFKLVTLITTKIKNKGNSSGPYIKPSQLMP